MTDHPDTPTSIPQLATQEPLIGTSVVTDWLAREQARALRRAELRPRNRDALFEALEQAGIATVEVEFDGGSDSGQIEEITAYDAAGERTLPDTIIAFVQVPYEGDAAERMMPLTDAVETLCYELLEETNPGWENNEGAFGTFTFDVAARALRLDHHTRFTDTVDSSHEF